MPNVHTETVVKIRRAYQHGFNAAEIGRVYGLKRSQVLRALGRAEKYQAARVAREIEQIKTELAGRDTLTVSR